MAFHANERNLSNMGKGKVILGWSGFQEPPASLLWQSIVIAAWIRRMRRKTTFSLHFPEVSAFSLL